MSADSLTVQINFINVRSPSDREEPLITFFQPFSQPKVSHEAHAVKSDLGLVAIVLTIVGTWAAERYILDPIANRVEEWWSSVTSLEGAQFRVCLQFNEAGNQFNLELVKTSNFLVLKSLWQYYRQVLGICAAFFPGELPINRIQLMPRNGSIIAIGYSGNRPSHYFNLEENSLLEIPKNRMPIEKQQEAGLSLEGQIFVLHVLEERLEYLKRLKGYGLIESEDEIKSLGTEIDEKWALLLTREA